MTRSRMPWKMDTMGHGYTMGMEGIDTMGHGYHEAWMPVPWDRGTLGLWVPWDMGTAGHGSHWTWIPLDMDPIGHE